MSGRVPPPIKVGTLRPGASPPPPPRPAAPAAPRTILGQPTGAFPTKPPNPVPVEERMTTVHDAVATGVHEGTATTVSDKPAPFPAPAPSPAAELPAPAAEPAPAVEPPAPAVEAAPAPAPRTATPPPPPPLPKLEPIEAPPIDPGTREAVDKFLNAKIFKGIKRVRALPLESLGAYLATIPYASAQKVIAIFSSQQKIDLEIIKGAYHLLQNYQDPGFKPEQLKDIINHRALAGTKIKALLQKVLDRLQPPAAPTAEPPAEGGTEVIEAKDVEVIEPAEMSPVQAEKYLNDIFNGNVPIKKREMIASVNELAGKYPGLSDLADDVLNFLAGYEE